MPVLDRFYSAFARHDWATMAACYHNDAHFSDPVFPDLDAAGVRAMWKMLVTSGTDLKLEFTVLEESANGGMVHWEARYTFSKTQRPVHNIIAARFTIQDGLIIAHTDQFDFWCWSRQALGITGTILGWTPIVRDSVRAQAAKSLQKWM